MTIQTEPVVSFKSFFRLTPGSSLLRLQLRPVVRLKAQVCILVFVSSSRYERSWSSVMVRVLARSPGCPSRHEPARSHGIPIPADNFPNELVYVCDPVGKSLARRGLDAAFPSRFVMVAKVVQDRCIELGSAG